MPSITKKELHLAQSLEDLKKKAEIKEFGKKTIQRVIEFSNKFYLEGKTCLNQGDSERAYYFFYRFSQIMSYVTPNDKNYYLESVGTKARDVMSMLEELDGELSRRYSENKSVYENRKASIFPNDSTPLPGTSVKVVDDVEMDDERYPCIDPKELYKLIESLSEINKILIIDIRSAEEFTDASIAANKLPVTGDINIINIPDNHIQPPLTFSDLRKKISFGINLDGLERRRSMDHVIIIDRDTNDFQKQSKSYILADALWKWDQSAEKVKNKPRLLKGGFRDFSLVYPMFITNPAILARHSSTSENFDFEDMMTNRKPIFNFYEFSREEENQNNIKNNNNILNNQHPDRILSSSMSNNRFPFSNNTLNKIDDKNDNRTTATVKKQSIPGIAKPIIPDRSSKPSNIIANNIDTKKNPSSILNNNNNNSSLQRNQLPPKPAHLLSSLNNNNNARNGSTIVESSMNGDDHDDCDFAAGKFDENDDVHMRNNHDYGSDDDSDMSDINNENRHHVHNNNNNNNLDSDDDVPMATHSTSKPLQVINNKNKNNNNGFTSNLSRSLSSPNIAQNLAYDDNNFSGPFNNPGISPKIITPSSANTNSFAVPSVDRSAKPLSYFNHHPSRDNKIRDFSPQYSSSARITGLRNLGNTCFMNSILQCLKNSREFYDYLVTGNWKIQNSKFGSNGQLTIELSELFKQMHHPSSCKHISPRDFKNAVNDHIPDFVDYKQQDAHEFLVRLLDRIHEDLNRARPNADLFDPVHKDPNYYDKLSMTDAVKSFCALHSKRNNSIVTDLFEGLIVSTLTCLHCKSQSKALEAFTCLTLPIPENSSRTTLEICLGLFLRGERLTNEVAWQCQECRQKRDAEKCTYILRLPKILIIHLKRFSYDGMWRQKINTFVDFKIDNFTIHPSGMNGESRTYSLYGVVNHFGSLEGGHYIAYSRNKELNIDWNKYDDQDVTPMSENNVVTQHAYVLFYKSIN